MLVRGVLVPPSAQAAPTRVRIGVGVDHVAVFAPNDELLSRCSGSWCIPFHFWWGGPNPLVECPTLWSRCLAVRNLRNSQAIPRP